jgi:TolB-like protein/Flp pilus assembly protein TadD
MQRVDAMSLWLELKRRNVFRVGAAYLVVAWLLIEVSDTIFPRLGLPEWTVTFVIALLIVGLPVALFLAWAFELTPEGVKRTGDVALQESVTTQTSRTIDTLILVGMVVVVAVIVADRFLLKQGGHGETVSPAEEAGPAESPAGAGTATTLARTTTADPRQADASGIAVLPFVNMSPDPENAYFADGISEELLNILGGIEGLKVASRTSAFSFKGKDTPIPEIARLLDVRHVLEGSVRKQGQRVRITAQLIEAGRDARLWSQTYERDLVDIFRVQEEIAVAITTALEAIIGTRQVSVDAPTDDMEAYQNFLRGRSSFYQRRELDRAIDDLQAAVDRDPGFAEAWAFLGAATSVVALGGHSDRDRTVLAERSDRAIARALELDPDIPIALAGMGRGLVEKGNVAEGLAMLSRAADRVAADTTARLWLGLTWLELGLVERALPHLASAQNQDPLVAINNGYLGLAYATQGRWEEGGRLARRAIELSGSSFWTYFMAVGLVNAGDPVAAHALLTDAQPLLRPDEAFGEEFLAGLLTALQDPAQRAEFLAANEIEAQGNTLTNLALMFRDEERVFRSADPVSRLIVSYSAWLPSLGWLREDPRFYAQMQERGAIGYWEAEGYPRGCRPVDDPAGRRLACTERGL